MLTLARIAQGFGGAALMSGADSSYLPQRHLGRGMDALLSSRSLFRRGSDDRRGDFIISSWKWLFLINVPLGIIALILAIRFCTSKHRRDTKRALTYRAR